MQFRMQALYNNALLSKLLFVVFIGEIVGLVTLGFLAVQGMEGTPFYCHHRKQN
jgi:hypothetical protein